MHSQYDNYDRSPRRQCSLCGKPYTDATGHDYDGCVDRIYGRMDEAKRRVEHLADLSLQALKYREMQIKDPTFMGSLFRGRRPTFVVEDDILVDKFPFASDTRADLGEATNDCG